jgi:L-cystine uptake protein TcyP (sodium:dicarboxylate symporter family)
MSNLILMLVVEFFVVIILFEGIASMIKQEQPLAKEVYKSLFIGVLIAIIVYLYIKS